MKTISPLKKAIKESTQKAEAEAAYSEMISSIPTFQAINDSEGNQQAVIIKQGRFYPDFTGTVVIDGEGCSIEINCANDDKTLGYSQAEVDVKAWCMHLLETGQELTWDELPSKVQA